MIQTMKDLVKQKCVPCEGSTKPFTKKEIREYLYITRDWEYVPGKPPKIQRKFVFKDFTQALNFVNKVGRLANQEDHHPDIFIHNYKKVDITLSTHSIGGLSTNDFILAAKINQLL